MCFINVFCKHKLIFCYLFLKIYFSILKLRILKRKVNAEITVVVFSNKESSQIRNFKVFLKTQSDERIILLKVSKIKNRQRRVLYELYGKSIRDQTTC